MDTNRGTRDKEDKEVCGRKGKRREGSRVAEGSDFGEDDAGHEGTLELGQDVEEKDRLEISLVIVVLKVLCESGVEPVISSKLFLRD